MQFEKKQAKRYRLARMRGRGPLLGRIFEHAYHKIGSERLAVAVIAVITTRTLQNAIAATRSIPQKGHSLPSANCAAIFLNNFPSASSRGRRGDRGTSQSK